ncbi:MAG: DUF2267 domain-containing protein [Christiangramia sp.]|uniref:Uncharacterized protein n=1 Tax=Christiangramia flava JLT2011 TaxID=1229726 RepID=A0A1L7I3H4_9FLAO|nr:DUF2267 domain-containing protein [Christiangramia flava]APU67695.1 hypothetical protein GRFL_0971 [Christiangramia flava JLT2011]MAM19655.1 DUF2267 domain-containing protein [Christiangramia sp.]OSS40199.1 hypothetical protein C723_0507 [Christiangramia flava JLT2011]|tara:strand:- start:92 stop:301 length:210 start_codon:yes stop_codon:yes gene_type:complete
MDEVVKMVAEKAGITEGQAKIAVQVVAGILKDRMPDAMAGQVDAYLKGEGNAKNISDMAGKLGGMFGKK